MSADARPDPDALLAKVSADERSTSRGRLRIFFGASAGVGKTYAMLQAAHERLAEGIDVVVGHVDTHGRAETMRLLEGLPVLPPRQTTYRESVLHEFDLDAALARKPRILLVDELAHTNVPESRHTRRYQDVEELLRVGIDVYTTLNVQHLESLNDLVAQITGIAVRETVPDSVLESADELELIDLPPDELLARLREGKVYVAEQVDRALSSFFKKGNLIALREMALRSTADRVDAQMQVYRKAEGPDRTWPIAEKILVCISPSPSAVRIVRAARRLARRLRADWTVLYVEQPRHLALRKSERDYAAEALRLAGQLGARTVTRSAHDAVGEILAFARAHNFSKIVVGKPGAFWGLREIFLGSFVGRLAHRSGDVDVFIVHGETGKAVVRETAGPANGKLDWVRYAWGAAVAIACSALALAMFPYFERANLIMVYLLGVVMVASRWGRGPSMLAALLGVGAFDFLFVPPRFTFAVGDSQYLLTLVVMMLVAFVISTLTVRIKDQAQVSRERERRTDSLYSLSRQLASTRNLDEMVAAVRSHVGEAFDGQAAIFLVGEGNRLELRSAVPDSFSMDPKEMAVAQWVHDHRQVAGRGTATLAGATGLHLPLVGSREPVGVLSVGLPPGSRPLATEQMHLLETFANQAALALERALLAREAHRQRLAAEGERLRNALLAAVSHDLRTPLAAISGASSSLVMGDDRLDPAARRELILTIHEEAARMSRLAINLLDMARLQAGGLVLRKEWQPLEEVLGAALGQLDLLLKGREVVTTIPDDLPHVAIDEVLIERVLVNLLENALRYSPAGTPIEVAASAGPGDVTVEVLDRGPGLTPGEEEEIFEKFFRGEAARSRHGAGLGLAVSRAIVETHGGRIWAENRAGGGAVFRFTLPREDEPPVHEESGTGLESRP